MWFITHLIYSGLHLYALLIHQEISFGPDFGIAPQFPPFDPDIDASAVSADSDLSGILPTLPGPKNWLYCDIYLICVCALLPESDATGLEPDWRGQIQYHCYFDHMCAPAGLGHCSGMGYFSDIQKFEIMDRIMERCKTIVKIITTSWQNSIGSTITWKCCTNFSKER